MFEQSIRTEKVAVLERWLLVIEVVFLPSPLSLLDGMLIHHRVTPNTKFAGTHLYSWVERDTLTVKHLAK